MQQCHMHAMEVNDWLSMQVDDWLSMQVDDWLSKSAVVVTTTLPTGASPPCKGHLEGLEVPRNLAALDICIQQENMFTPWCHRVKLGLGLGFGLW